MPYIEPCCYRKQLGELIDPIDNPSTPSGVAHFFSNSDWTFSELFSYFVERAPGGVATVVMPHLNLQSAQVIMESLMQQRNIPGYPEPVPLVDNLNILTSGSPESRKAILGAYVGGGDRICVSEYKYLAFRCIEICNGNHYYIIQGSINQERGMHAQMFTVTTGETAYRQASEVTGSLFRVHRLHDWQERYAHLI